MAILISQQATTPNLANNNLVYEVTSSLFANPQFQYICDIKSGSTLIQRIKQQPNPSGYGVFDIGSIVTSNVGPTDQVWTTAVPQTQTTCAKQFTVLFGEEYGTSVSSSVTIYNGITNATGGLAPARSGSSYYYNLDGTLDPNDKVNWNWNSGSKYSNQQINDLTFNYQRGLTDMPTTQSVRIYDWATISFLNGNLNGAANSASFAQDVYAMVVDQYDVTGSLLIQNTYYNVSTGADNGGPRSTPTQLWSQVFTSQSQDTRLIHFPVGPENINSGPGLEAGLAYYTVTFYEQFAGTGSINTDGVYGRYRFDIVDANCGYDGARFAWKNKYGVWDYYTFPLAQTTLDNIDRQTYKQTFVNFSTTSTTVSYNKARRGQTQFVNKITKNRTAETDWIDQETADAMLELFYSTDVYMQDQTPYSSVFLPIVVTNATLTEKTNPRTQKLFKYTITFTLANDTQNRL
jgi:hypothetical protein